ncbi:MAG TPA: hypothetical protein VE135_29300 [Pyrinomonadaceae bacterium]|nr:hypothetical protein [Pyrinomonadaceae bacterium]
MTLRLFILSLALLTSAMIGAAQQVADPDFNTAVAYPAYNKNLPRVLFDEAHNNFHTTAGRYKPFVDLISSDGYSVVPNRQPFSEKTLGKFKILVIANALGAEEMDDEGADRPAFTEEECDAVRDWVRGGGNLLLIADHAPFGGAAENLAHRFGVEMSKGFTFDPQHSEPNAPSLLIFSRENKLLLDHPIIQGRSDAERIKRVVTFTGQSLKGPAGTSVFLQLADSARDKADRTATTDVSVAGWGQGIAFKAGKGRVVMLGEAAMLSAQIAGAAKLKMGMNHPGSDNKQLALNIVHWLSGLLKER